ncbi:hypothetical protein CFP56_025513 [Quercus suber]|uniref:Pectinesterase inhibitor domain-containing protein n=1 Tax=Quercus suber TaxID=58331 RepID=A0AAW0LYG0_QUESU|nr:hypothetical protein CFP56_60950 [Quercus suber]
MASPISYQSIFVIPPLVTSLFYHVFNAEEQGWFDEDFLEKFCHNSADYDFCSLTLRSDKSTYTADPNGLVIISISINMNLVQTSISEIVDLIEQPIDALDKTRLQNCQVDFSDAQVKLNAAFVASATYKYLEGLDFITDEFKKSVECDSEYTLNPLKRESPLLDDTLKVQKLTNITFVIVGEIMSA